MYFLSDKPQDSKPSLLNGIIVIVCEVLTLKFAVASAAANKQKRRLILEDMRYPQPLPLQMEWLAIADWAYAEIFAIAVQYLSKPRPVLDSSSKSTQDMYFRFF